MYSRSYGFIESSEKNGKTFVVPPDYNGNLYRPTETNEPLERETPKEDRKESMPLSPSTQGKKPPMPSGFAGSFLERLTAEDILLFVFLYSLIRGDTEDNGSILGLILALLLL